MNNCTLAGRIVRYISLKTTTTGKSLVENCIAIRRNKDEIDFIEFVAWGTIADNLVKYSKMGDMIIVSGEIRADKFQTKNGEKRTKVYLLVNYLKQWNYYPNCGAKMDIGYEEGRRDGYAEAVEAEPVVRCKDCVYNKGDVNKKGFRICSANGMDITDHDYCSWGMRMNEVIK